MRYAIVIEKAGNNFSGYSPDLPGCVATGATIEETETELLSAIQFFIHNALYWLEEFHLDGLREDGIAPPPCESVVEYVLIPVQPLAPGETPRVLQGG